MNDLNLANYSRQHLQVQLDPRLMMDIPPTVIADIGYESNTAGLFYSW